ncbi:XAF1 factor, partial [Rhinopomastus cyanomelas]|nr:XAF1 factor [Rhinopomastus cyanomelas]
KRDVSAANLSLHEAHCLRFLTLCPQCNEPVAHKDMRGHQAEAHKQVRCGGCRRGVQQYQLEQHETQECPKRAVRCQVCELEMPFEKLEEHVASCASRTERCPECGRYVMYREQEEHRDVCRDAARARHGDTSFRGRGASADATSACPRVAPSSQVLSPQTQRSAARRVADVLADQPAAQPGRGGPQPPSLAFSSRSKSAGEWRDVRPKVKDGGRPPTSETLGRPPKNKGMGFPSPGGRGLPTAPPALGDTRSFDVLVACAHCDILLPLPTLEKHEVR